MSEVEPEIKVEKIEKGPRIGIRHIQILLLFLNLAFIYVSRVNVSVAVVAMTNAATTNPDFPEFDWTEKQKNYIQSSFYWGYIVLQFPVSYLNRRFGAKTTLFLCTFVSAIISLLTPYLVTLGSWQAYCAIRFVQGLVQGAVVPCLNDHIAKWSPKQERYHLGAFTYSGADFGIVCAMLFSGLIASSSWGWPGISYASGGLCLAWCILWLIFASTNPPSSRFITKEECQYIEASMNRENAFHEKKIPVPWHAILTSVPFLIQILIFWSEAWGFSTLQSQIPTYMNGVLNMHMKNNAVFSALPYIASWITCYIYMFVGMVVVRRRWLGLTAMRKVANTMAMWIPAAILIVIGFLDYTNEALIISLFVLGVGFQSGTAIGCQLAAIDLSPNHAGVVMGIANSLYCIVPLVTPLVAGVVVTDVHDRSEWQMLFGISALIGFFGNLIYIIFGTSETQPWDAPDFMEKSKLNEAKKAAL